MNDLDKVIKTLNEAIELLNDGLDAREQSIKIYKELMDYKSREIAELKKKVHEVGLVADELNAERLQEIETLKEQLASARQESRSVNAVLAAERAIKDRLAKDVENLGSANTKLIGRIEAIKQESRDTYDSMRATINRQEQQLRDLCAGCS